MHTEDNEHRAPEGYFESFYDRLKERLEVEEALEGLPREEGFRVPPDYFETLPDRLMEHTRPMGRVVSLPNRRLIAAVLAVAAAIVLIWKFGMENPGESAPLSFESLAQQDVEAYLGAYYREDLAFSGLSSTIRWEESDWTETGGLISEAEVSDDELYDYLDSSMEMDETLYWSYETQ